MNAEETVAAIKRLAAEVGYVDCGIASAVAFEKFAEAIEQRIAAFPAAASLYRSLLPNARPQESDPDVRSIIVCVLWYGKYEMPEGVSRGIGRNYLFDHRYPACPDHGMGDRFRAGLGELGLRVLDVPVPDRWAGVRAGVVRFGRNNFAYAGGYGSWINVVTFCVDRELPAGAPTRELACPNSCRRCIEACPTDALTEPLCMRWDHCVAHLTYRAPHPIPQELWRRMGHWVYGCDECQLVCPLNEGRWRELQPAPWLEEMAPHLSDEALRTMDEETYHNIVHPAFWYIPKDDLARWHRNAERALRVRAGRGPS